MSSTPALQQVAVVVQQVGGAVKRHGGLARAGPALHHERALQAAPG